MGLTLNMFTVLFRCDGGPVIGMGHVTRCLALAEELTRNHRCRAEFAVAHDRVATEQIGEAGYRVHQVPWQHTAAHEPKWIKIVAARCGAPLVVCDVREGLDLRGLLWLRRAGLSVVLLDDSSERRLAADLAFYPPMPQLQRLDWRGFSGHGYGGWKWVVLRRQFTGRRREVAGGPPMILLSAGGADPAGITLELVDALERVEGPMDPVVVLGSAYRQAQKLSRRLRRARHRYRVLSHVADMAALMAQADLAVVSFGMTAYELAAMGVPAIYVALSDDHADSASTFQQAGMGINLGVHQRVKPDDIAAVIRQLLGDPKQVAAMSARGRSLIDGRGAERVAHQIVCYLRRSCVPASELA
ncbi:MAG: glycosyltransferase [Planctomycetes bacterium]|nr:glycosyltransferase [Planctomycetota bacterium]